MTEEELGKKAYKRIVKARKFNTIVVPIGLIFMGLIGYIGTNHVFDVDGWVWGIVTVICFVLINVMVSYDLSNKPGEAFCPRCHESLERSKFYSSSIPTFCQNCKLKIVSRGD